VCSGHEFCMCWLLHVFCKFLANQYRPRTWLSVESQWNVDSNDILSVRKYSQLFMHESNTFLLKIRHWNQWANGGKKPKTAPFPWGKWTPHLVHQYLDPTHWPLQMTARSVYALRYNYARKSILVRMGCPKFTPKTAPSLQRLLPHIIHPSLNRPHLPSQTAYRSNQPFCHSTLSGPIDTSKSDQHTHRQTDGLGDRLVR